MNDVAVSGDGSVIFPHFHAGLVTVVPGNGGFCPQSGSFQLIDIDGYSVDAASNDAKQGIIAIANIYGYNTQTTGNILICSRSSGCNTVLTNSNMPIPLGVAMTKSGDCFGDSQYYSIGTLTYFAKCSGKGQAALGFINPHGGGLDIDGQGNLVTISGAYSPSSTNMSAVYVYHGCTPLCLKVGGPFPLKGSVNYGHLNKFSTRLVTANFYNGTVDVYSYSPTKLKYLYSFENGLMSNQLVVGAAVYPRSRE